MMRDDILGQKIHDMAIACGFDNGGIIPIEDMEDFANDWKRERQTSLPARFFIGA